MIRTILFSTAAALCLTLPAFSQDKEAECRKQGQIATNIMTERASGSNQRRAERRVIRALPEDAQNYEVAIPAMIQWIYSLPEDTTSAEVSNVVYQTCLSQ